MNELDLTIGAQIFCTDGKCGTLAKLAVNPETWQVTHLIVEEGFLLKRSRVFPFSSVERTTSAEIYLTIHSAELVNYPVYREETVERPAPEQADSGTATFWREGVPYGVGPAGRLLVISEKIRHGVPEDLAVVDHGTPVEGLDGGLGKLDHFLVGAAAGEITQIIVRQGLLLTTKRAVPLFRAESISEDAIFVQATSEELEGLPEYKAEDYDAHGAETNEGDESDNPGHPRASDPNVDLATRVTMALFEDPRTSGAVIEVIDDRGVITLDGEVDGPATRDAAKEITAAQPGVTTVVNLLRLRQ